ncbi:hypothetical protein SEPCBS119000_002506 [Sporothrix epigloea]|uniref:Aminoglycoside phosphotransferase domain-containing protein n=1 Tax=Sporothrix epigloea TaxID=1892477 RepID=A0ABP0DJR3_9PEZI
MSSTSPLPTSQAASEPRYIILFSKPDDSLPEPLPSLEAIENAPVISEDYSTKHIAFFGNSYVVKYGYDVEPLEADNMRFVRQNTTVRVPRVYAVYQSESLKEGKHKTYIIMEKIAGESLDKLWAEFGAEQKSRIIQQLKESFSALRSLPSPGYYGSIDKKRPRDYLFVIKEPTSSIDEPYYTEEALVNDRTKSDITGK